MMSVGGEARYGGACETAISDHFSVNIIVPFFAASLYFCVYKIRLTQLLQCCSDLFPLCALQLSLFLTVTMSKSQLLDPTRAYGTIRGDLYLVMVEHRYFDHLGDQLYSADQNRPTPSSQASPPLAVSHTGPASLAKTRNTISLS